MDIDRNSRVLLPERLLEFAALEHEVVLIGVQNHLEVWDARSWNDYLAQHGPRFDAVAEKAFKHEASEHGEPAV